MQENIIISYADDTAVISTAKTCHEVESTMNDLLRKISKWLALNKLSSNTDKTMYMEFGSQCNSTPRNLNININGIKIKRVESTKYLGLVFHSNMRWNEHIVYVYSKTKYFIFIFYKLMKIMSTDCLRMVFSTVSFLTV